MQRMRVAKGTPRGAVLDAARWPRQSILKIGFLDGDKELRRRVAGVATQWLTRTGADLAFNWLEDGRAADIRISFELNGSWSLLGRDVLTSAKPGEATMNYGWLKPGSTDVEVREVVLHEFGHALGFIHEHQNPVGGIEWNREEVIKSLSGPPNSWSVEEIERNVLAPYEPRSLIGTPFDPASIMLYPFPPEWTLNGFSSRNNTELSDRDIELARRIYT